MIVWLGSEADDGGRTMGDAMHSVTSLVKLWNKKLHRRVPRSDGSTWAEKMRKGFVKQVKERTSTSEVVHDDVKASQATATQPREDFKAIRLLCCERKW